MPPLFFLKSRSPPSSRKAGVCWQETPPASASPPNEDRLELSLQNNVLRRAGRGCATSNQPKLNCARHRPSPAVASSKVSLWMQLLAWESTTCPDGARKSVSVWHFGFDQHLLTTNSLSLSPWLHVLDVVRVTRRGKQWFAGSQSIFFQVCQQKKSQHSESLLPKSALLWTNPVSHPPRTLNKVHSTQGWQQERRLCSPGQKGFAGARGSSLRWLILWFTARRRRMHGGEYCVQNGESRVNRCSKSQLICTCSVVFQSLYFSHIEPLWWGIHWKP